MSSDSGEKPIRTISSREVYRNPWCSVREDVIERSVTPNGKGERGVYGVMDKEPACIVIPLESAEDGEFVWLVRQYRYTVGDTFYELPQGGWETAGVDPEELARGELKEETGLAAASMTLLGMQWIAYGFTRQRQFIFLATGLTETEKDPDPEEHDLAVRSFPIAEFETMLLDGTIRDNCTHAAWGLYMVWKSRQPR